MFNLCWFKHKNIFECFRCFWKVLCFYKNWKISKNSVALFWQLSRGSSKSHDTAASSHVDFGDLFASERASREGYTKIFAAQLTTPSRVNLPIAKNTSKFFSQFCLWVFWQLALATCWRLTPIAKNVCLAKSGSVFKNPFSFSSNFLWLFTFSLNWISSKHSVSLSTNSIFALFHLQIFKKKVWVLISSPHISCFELHFCEYLCWCFVYGFVSFFFGLSLFGLLRYLFLCELVSVDRFMYYHVLVFLR